jgi:hypothetical protein
VVLWKPIHQCRSGVLWSRGLTVKRLGLASCGVYPLPFIENELHVQLCVVMKSMSFVNLQLLVSV